MTIVFTTCPYCNRPVLGRHKGSHVYPQPHSCKPQPRCPECRNDVHRNCTGWALDETTDEVISCGCVLHVVSDE